MNRYTDPQGLFGIEYPLGWRVRAASPGGKPTSFYLDDPDEGIALIVLTQGAVQGDVRTAAFTSLLIQQMRLTYPDFRLTTVSTRPLSGGGEQSEFVALWTNRWAQRMRAKGVIVSAARGGATSYSYVAGQAQEVVFPGLEPVIQRMLVDHRIRSSANSSRWTLTEVRPGPAGRTVSFRRCRVPSAYRP